MSEVQASTTESQDNSTQATAIESSAPSQTTSQEAPAAAPSLAESLSQGENPQAAPAPYTPNFKFKIKDQEKEFDEWIRPVIKDPDTEKKVKEMYEKAFGLDEVKSSRDSFKTKFEEVNTKYSNVEKSLTHLSKYVQKKDYASFFESLQIPKEDIVKWTINELKYEQLPLEQKQAIEQQRNLARTQEQFETQQETHQRQMQEFAQQQLQFELSKPDVQTAMQTFDQRAGRPGAFQQEVINRGAYYEQVHGKTVPASLLVKELLAFVSPSGQQAVPQVDPQGQQLTPSQGVQTQEAKPTIKVFQSGGNSSPVKKQVNSIDDLRKLRSEMA